MIHDIELSAIRQDFDYILVIRRHYVAAAARPSRRQPASGAPRQPPPPLRCRRRLIRLRCYITVYTQFILHIDIITRYGAYWLIQVTH